VSALNTAMMLRSAARNPLPKGALLEPTPCDGDAKSGERPKFIHTRSVEAGVFGTCGEQACEISRARVDWLVRTEAERVNYHSNPPWDDGMDG
jgi:hypothetical protein